MKRQHLVILIILVAVIGGLGLVLRQRQSDSWNDTSSRAGQELLAKFDRNEVTQILIKGTNELHLSKTGDIWTVQERDQYPANFSKVVEVVNKLADLKIIQPQHASQETLNRFQLLPPGQGSNSATVVGLKDKDGKVLADLRLGKKHMSQSAGGMGGEWPDGRYVMVGDDLNSVALVKDALTDLEPQADPWINKDFLKVERIQAIEVTTPEPTNSWALSRETETGDWKLAEVPEGKELDKTKITSLGSLLASPYFTDVVTGKKPEEVGLAAPRVATVRTFDHFTYTLRVGETNAEGNHNIQVDVTADLPTARPAVPDETPEAKETADKQFKEQQDKLKEKLAKEQRLKNWVYLVSKWTVDPLLKNKADLLTDKKAEPPPPATPQPTLFPDPTLPLPSTPGDEAVKPPPPPPPDQPADAPKPAQPEEPTPTAPPPAPEPEKPAEKGSEPEAPSEPEKPAEPEPEQKPE